MLELNGKDRSLRPLMVQTLTMLQTHPGLWTPPLVLNLLLAVVATNGARGYAVLLPVAIAWLLSIAFRAGWLEQMHRVVSAPGETSLQPTWGHFLEGVGHYFWRLLGGEIAQALLLAAGLGAAVAYGASTIGIPERAILEQVLKAAKASGRDLEHLPAATIEVLNAWTLLFLGWGAFWAVVACALLFWPTYAILQDKTWPRAWVASIRAVGSHFRFVLPLIGAQFLAYLLVFQLVASGPGLLMMFGYAGYLLVWTFFSLLPFLIVQRWEAHGAAASPEGP